MSLKAPVGKILVKTDKDEKLTKDLGSTTIVISEGWNPYDVSTNVPYGIVEAVPDDIEEDIKVGDKMYGHHFLVDNEIEDGIHWQLIKDVVCVIRDGEIIMLNDWNFLEPESAEQKTESGIFLTPVEGDREDRAIVKHASKFLKSQGVKRGDTVYFRKDCDKPMDIEGEVLFRNKNTRYLWICLIRKCFMTSSRKMNTPIRRVLTG